jgi:hypothetical protein
MNILIVCGEQRIESSVDEFLALNDLRDRKHFLACMKASEIYTGHGARGIVYQVWPVVADVNGGSPTFSESAGLALRAANSP